ncbi:hypothetical protein [Nonomuraea sp. NPDC052265]|uniref:hypothetical protein n=1 Tax=Nonomuraea sp. NPDC052265 TaxID=3364374 RepID=UPI0037CC0040
MLLIDGQISVAVGAVHEGLRRRRSYRRLSISMFIDIGSRRCHEGERQANIGPRGCSGADHSAAAFDQHHVTSETVVPADALAGAHDAEAQRLVEAQACGVVREHA